MGLPAYLYQFGSLIEKLDLGGAMYSYENEARSKGYSIIAGVDEAGRGPIAGPVVAAAVVLPEVQPITDPPIVDSKKLSHDKRERLSTEIFRLALSVGVGISWPEEIDRVNILNATKLAMARAVSHISVEGEGPDLLLIDGPHPIETGIEQRAIVKGDSLSRSIAAASIIAKVTRDRIMASYHLRFPEYCFNEHKGYGTKKHREAIRAHGRTDIHRKSFKFK